MGVGGTNDFHLPYMSFSDCDSLTGNSEWQNVNSFIYLYPYLYYKLLTSRRFPFVSTSFVPDPDIWVELYSQKGSNFTPP
jgi:hypothetical protein